ncbi:hypothetical protein ACTJIJ_05850 [Niabella sp. 22666]|uniref:hypothetical protein n=1 Tax=Niabella sp. 22666 TaxID=3453954 RepID=UPI003F838ABC
MSKKINHHIRRLTDLPDPLQELVDSLLRKSLGEKAIKVKFTFALINDIPKSIQQLKKQLKNYPDLPILPQVYKYELFFVFLDSNIKDYQIFIGIDEHFQILHYNLPVNPEHALKALYGEREAISLALDYAIKNSYPTEIESSDLKYSLDKRILIWSIYLLQEKINSKRKKCLALEVNLFELKDNIYATEVELTEVTISSIEMVADPFEPPPPPPPPKKEDI